MRRRAKLTSSPLGRGEKGADGKRVEQDRLAQVKQQWLCQRDVGFGMYRNYRLKHVLAQSTGQGSPALVTLTLSYQRKGGFRQAAAAAVAAVASKKSAGTLVGNTLEKCKPTQRLLACPHLSKTRVLSRSVAFLQRATSSTLLSYLPTHTSQHHSTTAL